MTLADKTIFIQYYQCKYSTWLNTFNKRLETGIVKPCDFTTNILVSNLIKVLYRFKAEGEDIPECISEEEFCTVVNKLKSLLKEKC